jgi:pilus assembly protein CpaE
MPDTPRSEVSNVLSVAIIVPDMRRRRLLTTALASPQIKIVREFDEYPSSGDQLEIGRLACQVAVVDLDHDVASALAVIEDICRRDAAIAVMAYAAKNDPVLMRQSMQAGAREFLVEPLLPEMVNEAFDRASARLPSKQRHEGKTLVFLQSKGGGGVSTIAVNFALALTKESGARVVVVDLDFQLGEVAPLLGMTATFSVVDALMNPERLDREFLSTLLLRHSSGLAALASAEAYGLFHGPAGGASKLFEILRSEFDYVVVDSGTCHSHVQEAMFEAADTMFLVAETTFPSIRNAHRLIAFLSATERSRGLQVVMNRFDSRHDGIDERSAVKALGRPVNWRIPNSYAIARAAQDNGVPLAMADSPITRVLVQMARAACGKPGDPEKKTRSFSFFRHKTLLEPVKN